MLAAALTAKEPTLALAQGLACSLSTGAPLQKAEQDAGDACEGNMRLSEGFPPGCGRSAVPPAILGAGNQPFTKAADNPCNTSRKIMLR